jgi:HemY protein
MLWSLLKFLLFIGIVAALSLGAIYLIDTGAGVRIAIADWEFTLGPVQAVIAGVILLLVVWLVLRLAGLLVAVLKFLNGDETAISRWFSRNRERRGYEALADGLMALASGEARIAMSKAATAERYLKRPELTNLVTAQAAEMAGDRAKAEEVYKRLLADDRTRFVGVLGIMKQKLAQGDTEMALKLAEKAFALKPRHEETQDVLLRLQAEQHDWKGARKTLSTKLKYGALPRPVHKRRDAVLALGEAKDILDADQSIEAREAAIEANRLSPDLVPAAAMAARAPCGAGPAALCDADPQEGLGRGAAPRPRHGLRRDRAGRDAAAADQALRGADQAESRHPETRLLLAELNVAAEDFASARKALGDLPETAPNTRVLALLAAIERGEGAPDQRVRLALLHRVFPFGQEGAAVERVEIYHQRRP